MGQLEGWVENSTPNVKPVGLMDMAAHLIDSANKYNYESTKDIHSGYVELVSLLRSYNVIWQANVPDEIERAKKEISAAYGDLINDLENYFTVRPDELTKICIQDLKARAVHFKVY